MRRAGHGRIITVTSLGGKVPAPHLLPYAAAKHAAVGFSEGLCVELAKYGISVTTAVPGLMRTGSPDNALFKGNKTAEHAWFAIADSLPLLTMDAERAARAIVRAGLRGRSEIILTPAAQVAARVHGLLPELTTRALILVDRMLPANENSTAQPGRAVATDSALFRWLTTLTRQAASRWHETTDRTRADGKPEIHRGADRSD
jgi:NAD(P)-dependent dehydrogenase (short-subunit alcohol dehydrogenase family)